jgi:hypothetical protein
MTTPDRFMEDVLSTRTNADAEARVAVLRARFTEDVRFYDNEGVGSSSLPVGSLVLSQKESPFGPLGLLWQVFLASSASRAFSHMLNGE